MSGHSKWSTIKRQKGANDAKRGQQFTKLANAIFIAVKQGGGIAEPEANFKLRLAIDKARSFNMPKENIERAILKAKGGIDGGDLAEVLYEAFAPAGAALVVEAVTDNKQRTISEVKNVIEKNGGTMGNSGSVSYLFNRLGEIVIEKKELSSDEVLELAIDLNSTDYFENENEIVFYVEPSSLYASRKILEERGRNILSSEIVFKARNELDIPSEKKQKVLDIIEKLEDLGDVQNVFTNITL